MRIETTRKALLDPRRQTTETLAYPQPPSPPNSELGENSDSDDDYFSADESFSALPHRAHTAPLHRSHTPPNFNFKPNEDAATAVNSIRSSATNTTSSSRTSSKRERARMAAKIVSKPIRRSYVSMVAGLASSVGFGQAMFLKATYQSPPDARGPRSGIETPARLQGIKTDTLSSAEGHVSRVSLPAGSSSNAATKSTEKSYNAAVDAAVNSVREQLQGIDLSPTVETINGEVISKPKRILIIGDSLVSGVGGESSFDDGPSDGPALPRQVARYLCELLNVDVQWNAMSLTGGDVRMLKRKIIPMLTRERERGTIGDISAVVLVTGVNDWKRISPIRTANKFRQDLAEFITKIRQQVGENVSVFLPAIPGVHHTPRFHEPLRSILIFLNDYWDSQKVQLSRSMDKVYFVGQPPNHEWGNNPLQFFSVLDRVHPSELGYERWARRIAEHMVAAFEKSKKVASDASAAVSSATQKATAAASNVVQKASKVATSAKKDVVDVSRSVSGNRASSST